MPQVKGPCVWQLNNRAMKFSYSFRLKTTLVSSAIALPAWALAGAININTGIEVKVTPEMTGAGIVSSGAKPPPYHR